MAVRADLQNDIAPSVLIAPTAVVDATPVLSGAVDVRSFAPGSRFYLVFTATEDNAANTGGTFAVTDCDTSGGTYASATILGSLPATPAEAGTVVRECVLVPNPARPFVKVSFTGEDADTEVTITATLLVVPRTL